MAGGGRWRCPRCGAEAQIGPRYGGEVVAVYCLCGSRGEPVRMVEAVGGGERGAACAGAPGPVQVMSGGGDERC